MTIPVENEPSSKPSVNTLTSPYRFTETGKGNLVPQFMLEKVQRYINNTGNGEQILMVRIFCKIMQL